jgi:Domain of unknown function (DUF222)
MPAAPDPADADLVAPPGASLHPDVRHVTALLEYVPVHAGTAATERGDQAVGRDAADGGNGEPAGHDDVSVGRDGGNGEPAGHDDVSVGRDGGDGEPAGHDDVSVGRDGRHGGDGGGDDGDGGDGRSAVRDDAPDGWLSSGFVPPDGGPLPEDWFPSAAGAVGPGGGASPGTGARGYLDPEETGRPAPAWTAGFAQGGVLDAVAAGLALAGFAAEARDGAIDDDELIGVIRAWRRLASWAAAGELEAIAALARRRPAPGAPPAAPDEEVPAGHGEFVPDEVAAALTLTPGKAWLHTDLAVDLATRLRAVRDCLAAGWIDLAKAQLFHTATRDLTDAHAAAVVAAVLPGAPDMTTARLRRALDRAVQEADPESARQARDNELACARVDCWPNPSGTGNIAGRFLPSADVLAADKRLDAIARAWKAQGAAGDMDQLRARAYLQQLLGHDPATAPSDLLPASTPSSASASAPAGDTGRAADPGQWPPGLRRPDAAGPLPPLAGSVNLTVPLATLLGLSDSPGEASGYGPLDPDTVRALACAAAGHRSTRWHITVTGPTGHALGYGTATGGRKTSCTPSSNTTADATSASATSAGASGWQVNVTAEPIAVECCDHRNQEPQYRPSPALQRLICARSNFCSYIGCGRPARRCDLDHTIPYDDGGITCECNIAPLCRHHHRMKQAQDWKLEQITPGVMAWLTPAGRRYITLPSQHPT